MGREAGDSLLFWKRRSRLCVYIYIYTHMCMYVYTEREREGYVNRALAGRELA